LFSEYKGNLVTSNDVIIWDVFLNKQGKASVRNELSFICGLYGMEVEFDDNFIATFNIPYQAHFMRDSKATDRKKVCLAFEAIAMEDLENLKNECLDKKYSEKEFIENLYAKYVEEANLMSTNFYRTVLYSKLYRDYASSYYTYITEQS